MMRTNCALADMSNALPVPVPTTVTQNNMAASPPSSLRLALWRMAKHQTVKKHLRHRALSFL